MAEFETIKVVNPTKEEFSVRFNGEMYVLKAGEEKSYPSFLGLHIAKHLSDKILSVEAKKLKEKNKENPYVPEASQLMIHDNPKRRMSLFDILHSTDLVEQCILSFPFNGFVGEMETYSDYVVEKSKKIENEKNDSISPEDLK